MFKTAFLSGIVALLAGAAAAADDDGAAEEAVDHSTYVLQYKFEPNETLRSEVVHRATVETTIQGTSQTAETRSVSIKAWKVTGVNAKGYIRFVHSVESIDMWQHTQGRKEVRYNSLSDKQPPAGYEEVAKAVGSPLTIVTIDAQGRVLKREEMHPQSNNQSTQLAIPLPRKPARIGHKWSIPVDLDVLLSGGVTRKIQTKQQYRLAAVSSGVATIEVDTLVLTPVNDPAIEAQLMQRLLKGTIRFDIDRGRVLSQRMDLDRRVIGFSGASSSMHYLTRFTEKLLTDEEVAEYVENQRAAKSAKRPAGKAVR